MSGNVPQPNTWSATSVNSLSASFASAVPLALPSGTTFNLRLVRLTDRYVGPQGESYAELPSSEALAERYLPKPQPPQ